MGKHLLAHSIMKKSIKKKIKGKKIENSKDVDAILFTNMLMCVSYQKNIYKLIK